MWANADALNVTADLAPKSSLTAETARDSDKGLVLIIDVQPIQTPNDNTAHNTESDMPVQAGGEVGVDHRGVLDTGPIRGGDVASTPWRHCAGTRDGTGIRPRAIQVPG